jgi:hypothetical protein
MQYGYALFWVIASTVAGAVATPAHAKNGLSELSEVAVMPVASVVVAASAVATIAVATPIALATDGAVLSVIAVKASAQGTVFVLERASDGARVSVEIAGKLAKSTALALNSTVKVSLLAAGTVLSVAGEVLAIIPSAIGAELLHSERITD